MPGRENYLKLSLLFRVVVKQGGRKVLNVQCKLDMGQVFISSTHKRNASCKRLSQLLIDQLEKKLTQTKQVVLITTAVLCWEVETLNHPDKASAGTAVDGILRCFPSALMSSGKPGQRVGLIL